MPFTRPALLMLVSWSLLESQLVLPQLKPFVSDPRTPGLTLLPAVYGPYSGHFLRGGVGLAKPLPQKEPVLEADAPWSLSAWVEVTPGSAANVTIAGVGQPGDPNTRLFTLLEGRPALALGGEHRVQADATLAPGWHLLLATFASSTVRFFVDGVEAGHGELHAAAVRPTLVLAPVETACARKPCPHFGGSVALLTLSRVAMQPPEIVAAARAVPDFRLIAFEEGSKSWPLQTVQFAGNSSPQEPATLPHRTSAFSKPVVQPLPPLRTTLEPVADGDWVLRGGWRLVAVPQVTAKAAEIASLGFDAGKWLPATVPGTALTTMIDRGLYPEPDFGWNNLAIPELLNRQSYWYRAEFASPAAGDRHSVRLVLDGINYRAEVWLNGSPLGVVTGAFVRGVFDVSGKLHPDRPNVIAIMVSPPPHPGIPNVQSIAFGAGLNGGAMAIDGPTFMATEGWDWMPPVRDRDTGLWQDVHLVATGAVTLGDPRVVTHLDLPDLSHADVTLDLAVSNGSRHSVSGTMVASFEGVTVQKTITLPPGESSVSLTPAEYPRMHLTKPRLWWPNGYGKPELYHLQVHFIVGGRVSAAETLRFGIREVTYELSLLDRNGDLRRFDYDPTLDRPEPGSAVDVTHEGMRQVPGGWASSVASTGEGSPALRPVADLRATPDLILRVNGVRIAVRGGSWGMDDTRKRVSRQRLEPFFRLNRDANLNIIRNWQGQNTEPVFFDLADEYGLMVWNDFWEVTQDSNAEAGDPQLFLRNAEDTILRYRNHPSIVLWCGRNEGVPQPTINLGLIALTHTLDGTRFYSPSSNQVNLQPSGPYSYQDPAAYYTTVDRGFAVEVGTPSLPTLEWFSRWLPAEDRWPIDDLWAYHNWHPHEGLNAAMQAQFGVADSLQDYVRKAQMMNYTNYRAIFEGFNQHLWAPNGGRLLWMTQPAWPSMLWGILSSDYDTQASFYATRKACEPLHVQMDLPNNEVAVVNTTRESLRGATIRAEVYGLDGKQRMQEEQTLDAAANDITPAMHLALEPWLAKGVVLVRLQLLTADGALRSDNLYWRAGSDSGYRALTTMPSAPVEVRARLLSAQGIGADRTVEVRLHNASSIPVLQTRLVLRRADGTQVMPAFFSDNYVSLLSGEKRTVTIQIPAEAQHGPLRIESYGWNSPHQSSGVLGAVDESPSHADPVAHRSDVMTAR